MDILILDGAQKDGGYFSRNRSKGIWPGERISIRSYVLNVNRSTFNPGKPFFCSKEVYHA